MNGFVFFLAQQPSIPQQMLSSNDAAHQLTYFLCVTSLEFRESTMIENHIFGWEHKNIIGAGYTLFNRGFLSASSRARETLASFAFEPPTLPRRSRLLNAEACSFSALALGSPLVLLSVLKPRWGISITSTGPNMSQHEYQENIHKANQRSLSHIKISLTYSERSHLLQTRWIKESLLIFNEGWIRCIGKTPWKEGTRVILLSTNTSPNFLQGSWSLGQCQGLSNQVEKEKICAEHKTVQTKYTQCTHNSSNLMVN